MHGILLIDKPAGLTSHDVVDRVRALTDERRIGHAGTLDPFATGLLIILIGRRATREQERFAALPKTYEATLQLGATSTTHDPEGEIKKTKGYKSPNDAKEAKDEFEKTLETFVGTYQQRPPRFSAKRVGGKRSYDLARRGKHVALQPVPVTIYDCTCTAYTWPNATITTTVSSGTYIRALARDIGEHLNSGAYLTRLRRTSIGPFNIDAAVPLHDLNRTTVNAHRLPIEETLQRLDKSSVV